MVGQKILKHDRPTLVWQNRLMEVIEVLFSYFASISADRTKFNR